MCGMRKVRGSVGEARQGREGRVGARPYLPPRCGIFLACPQTLVPIASPAD